MAYDRQAAMVMQELLWLRSNKVVPCGAGMGTAADLERDLFDSAEGLFVKALAQDPMLADAWLQGGILPSEQQQSGYALNTFKAAERHMMLELASHRFARASELSPWDGYAWQRWARSELQLVGLGLDDPGPLQASADAHFCKSASVFEEAWESRGVILTPDLRRGATDLPGVLAERGRAGFGNPCPGLTRGSVTLIEQ